MTPRSQPDGTAGSRNGPLTIIVALTFLTDLIYWAEADPRMTLKILRLMTLTVREPSRGLGKPEPLKHDLRGLWSRRITDEHRLVYRLAGSEIEFAKARGHYT